MLFHGFDESQVCGGGFVSIGNFDGVHRGHQAMLQRLVARARENGVPAVVLTFHPHPIEVLRPGQTPPALTTLLEKAALLEQHGIDCVIALRPDRPFLALTPDEFFRQIVRDKLQARGLVEGTNFFYGRNRAGNIDTLTQECIQAGLTCDVIPSVTCDGEVVSSSLIRQLLQAGDVARAARFLDRYYAIDGIVIRGAARGRTLGFPTANVAHVETLLPAEGVYAGWGTLEGTSYRAAINLGPNPTFAEPNRKLEVHLLDFAGDIYGQELRVSFHSRLRDVQKFAGKDALLAQLQTDLQRVREF